MNKLNVCSCSCRYYNDTGCPFYHCAEAASDYGCRCLLNDDVQISDDNPSFPYDCPLLDGQVVVEKY